MDDYVDALEWLYARQRIGIKLGLDKVEHLMAAIGTPHQRFDIVHVAGTNGKGSVARLMAETLQRAGQTTGLFTSPHLVHFRERIRIDGQAIPEADVVRGLAALRPAIDALDAKEMHPTFFEITTVLACWWFAEQGAQWAVLETGLGGRLDATNVVTPRISIITHIALDHEGMLGTTIGEIAAEKAGIMKPGVPCVTSAQDEALLILKATSLSTRSPMSIVGEDYHVLPAVNGFRLAHPGGEAAYELGLAGEHQLQNAAVVVAAVAGLRAQGVTIPEPALQQALSETRIAGRLEMRQHDIDGRRLEILLDGAHNPSGAGALRYHLGRIDWAGFAWITGFNADKDWHGMLDQIMPLAGRVYGVPLRSTRSLSRKELEARVQQAGFLFTSCDDVAGALAQAAADGAEQVLIAGSLFLVGEAEAVLNGESLEEVRGGQ